ncbi:undecaprenyl-diphosphatase [Longimycelium tulufanense]|uniref:Undecaprenyl-diphosphatase n=1 Tax=Longimycelium tulufanense TaxID=907463 RepID=A0A8J3C776_9PSEU|nr:phosphatase PAP2 family protein [Longimycelium tulufanense]GGM47746.1 undecaprenyl-diphosphatase [Longimycelium tulufanense]
MNDLVFGAINGLAGESPALDAVMRFAAGPLIYVLFVVGAAVTVLAMRGRNRVENLWLAGQVAAALALGFAINRVLRWMDLSQRPFQTRPVHQLMAHAPGTSLPSNHATAALTVVLVVGLFASAAWGLALAVPALLIAVSRVFVGVHWPADILVGGLVGLVAVFVVRWGAGKLRERYANSSDSSDDQSPPGKGPDQDATVVLPRVS